MKQLAVLDLNFNITKLIFNLYLTIFLRKNIIFTGSTVISSYYLQQYGGICRRKKEAAILPLYFFL